MYGYSFTTTKTFGPKILRKRISEGRALLAFRWVRKQKAAAQKEGD